MNSNSNVIPIKRGMPKSKVRQHSWIGTLGFYTTIKLILLVGGLGTAAFGLPSLILGETNDFTTIWFIAFILMLIVWLLEQRIIKKFYLKVKSI